MERALALARQAASEGEIPVGAVVVRDGAIIGEGRNCTVAGSDPTGHAEVLALRDAARHIGNYRLEGCTLYVTLEPCAMCAGAVLHARLSRLVIGAADPKTGAAGSVIDLFSHTKLNHHTEVTGGVLESACSEMLLAFFADLRQARAADKTPLREDALRTPESRFAGLTDFALPANYRADLDGIEGLLLHYLDEGPRDAPLTMLCLHSVPGWSYAFRDVAAALSARGCRVVAPDLIGCGKSDKPKREDFHSHVLHRTYLQDLVERLDLRNVVLVLHGWGGTLGLTLPHQSPHRYCGLVAINCGLPWETSPKTKPAHSHPLNEAQRAALSAPYPDAGHRAVERSFTSKAASFGLAQAATAGAARAFLSGQWQAPVLLVEDAADVVHSLSSTAELQQIFGSYATKLTIDAHGVSWEEQGDAIARAALSLPQPG